MLAETIPTAAAIGAAVGAGILGAGKVLTWAIPRIKGGHNGSTKYTRAIELDSAMLKAHDIRIVAVEKHGERLAKLETSVSHISTTVERVDKKIDKLMEK